ncbi:MAG TPA: hypothetical protein VKA47_07530, partial [Solirubrobacterales bacterium]|nr:hypothetical protein [Solirubrobacterales bacterium]
MTTHDDERTRRAKELAEAEAAVDRKETERMKMLLDAAHDPRVQAGVDAYLAPAADTIASQLKQLEEKLRDLDKIDDDDKIGQKYV